MAEETEVIRGQIEETRSKLTENLASLEGQIRGTVAGVKDNLRKFSPAHQARERPLVAVGGALLAGVAVGAWVGRKGGFQEVTRAAPRLASRGGSKISSLVHQFDDEFRTVRNMAFGAFLKGAGEIAKNALPDYRNQIEDVMKRALAKVEHFGDTAHPIGSTEESGPVGGTSRPVVSG